MRSYANTYPQLMNQAMVQDWNEQKLIKLVSACRLAEGLLSGLSRGTGVPFICHGIRTASIVMYDADEEVVIAALLHAVYFLHTFEKSSRRGPRPSDRRQLKSLFSDRTEHLICQYTTIKLNNEDQMQGYLEQATECTDLTRDLLLMALSNELEDQLDVAENYIDKSVKLNHNCIVLAKALGFSELAFDLTEAFDQSGRARIPQYALTGQRGSYQTQRLWRANPIEYLGSILRRYRGR